MYYVVETREVLRAVWQRWRTYSRLDAAVEAAERMKSIYSGELQVAIETRIILQLEDVKVVVQEGR